MKLLKSIRLYCFVLIFSGLLFGWPGIFHPWLGVQEAQAAWLSGWAKRIEITVSNSNIDSDLTHFPLLLTLGTSVGTGNDDVSAIFDELTSDANRKKIAVTKSDGTTQVYVDIAYWDDATETAILFVSKSDLTFSSSGTTTLYLYYDSSQSDNTTYVGDPGDAVVENVYDSDYISVHHMQEASGDIIDSIGTADGTAIGTPVYEETGKFGKSILMSNNEGFNLGQPTEYDGGTAWTWEGWVKRDDVFGASPDHFSGIFVMGINDNRSPTIISANNTDEIAIDLQTSAGLGRLEPTQGLDFEDDVWALITVTWDGSTIRAYKNGVESSNSASIGGTKNNLDADYMIGGNQSWFPNKIELHVQ